MKHSEKKKKNKNETMCLSISEEFWIDLNTCLKIWSGRTSLECNSLKKYKPKDHQEFLALKILK